MAVLKVVVLKTNGRVLPYTAKLEAMGHRVALWDTAQRCEVDVSGKPWKPVELPEGPLEVLPGPESEAAPEAGPVAFTDEQLKRLDGMSVQCVAAGLMDGGPLQERTEALLEVLLTEEEDTGRAMLETWIKRHGKPAAGRPGPAVPETTGPDPETVHRRPRATADWHPEVVRRKTVEELRELAIAEFGKELPAAMNEKALRTALTAMYRQRDAGMPEAGAKVAAVGAEA